MLPTVTTKAAAEIAPGREDRCQQFFEKSRDGVLFHVNGIISDVNPAMLKISGYKASELIGASIFQWIHPRFHRVVKEKIISGNDDGYTISLYHKSGKEVSLYVRPTIASVGGRNERFIVIKELLPSRLAAAPPRAPSVNHFDPMTNLPSRHLLKRWVIDMTRLHDKKQHQFAVIHIAIERMNIINDIFGRDVGDQLLNQWVKLLRGRLRASSPHLLSRIDGNHFAIAMPYIKDSRSVIRLLENIQAELDVPYNIGEHCIDNIRSIYGLALFPHHGTEAEELMGCAEIASRHARQPGSDSILCFSENMATHSLDNLKLETRLNGALERDEMVLYYQPKVNAQTEQIVGFEALIRWFGEGNELISPDQFIPIAEESGSILTIGEWVIWSVCEHLALLQERPGPTPQISLNLSSLQFQQPNLVDIVLQALTLFNVDPGLLDLELTESAVMADVEASITTLQQLKALGVSISIDDFGTGYSSLSYLKRFPINTLKVDQSFIADINTNPQDESITRAIITLAKSLQLETIAEGVETRAQLELLKSMECDLIQGFLFGRPMPLQEALKLL